MKRRIITLLTIILIVNLNAFSQFTDKDVTISVNGLSEEYTNLFVSSENKTVLLNTLNQLNITKSIAPINISVDFKNGLGLVTAEVNYSNDIIESNSDYNSHNEHLSLFSKGISIYLMDQLFIALSQYKQSVATKDWQMDRDLIKFQSAIKCQKTSGDFATFYASNYFDSKGFYPHIIYDNVSISLAGQLYETESTNSKTLNEMKYFMVGKTIGLDGSETGAYYFCKFFNIDLD